MIDIVIRMDNETNAGMTIARLILRRRLGMFMEAVPYSYEYFFRMNTRSFHITSQTFWSPYMECCIMLCIYQLHNERMFVI